MGIAKKYTGEKTEFQQFSFETREKKTVERKPFLIIELVIAPGKKVKIPLYSSGNGPRDVQ